MKNLYQCHSCNINAKKSEFKLKTIRGEKTYVCQKCGYYNSPGIFNK